MKSRNPLERFNSREILDEEQNYNCSAKKVLTLLIFVGGPYLLICSYFYFWADIAGFEKKSSKNRILNSETRTDLQIYKIKKAIFRPKFAWINVLKPLFYEVQILRRCVCTFSK